MAGTKKNARCRFTARCFWYRRARAGCSLVVNGRPLVSRSLMSGIGVTTINSQLKLLKLILRERLIKTDLPRSRPGGRHDKYLKATKLKLTFEENNEARLTCDVLRTEKTRQREDALI